MLPPVSRSVPDLPFGGHDPQIRRAGGGCAIHEPDEPLAGDGVLPDKVGLPVTVDIAAARDLPCGRDDTQVRPAGEGCAIHEPDEPLAGGGVLPDKVVLAVAI